MRQIVAACALIVIVMLFAPRAVFAQSAPPTVEQITEALGRPAAMPSADPLRVTPGMLRSRTRGIIPALAVRAPTTAPVSPTVGTTADACSQDSGSCALSIEFENGSATLTPNAVAALDNLGQALTRLHEGGFRFRVEGHTDTVGGDTYNLSLSEQRAAAVRTYLSEHFAIDPTHLQPVGMGKEHPLVRTPDQTPEPRNRRVQVVNIGA